MGDADPKDAPISKIGRSDKKVVIG